MNFEHTSFKELQALYTERVGRFPFGLSRQKILEELAPYFKKRGGKREGAGRPYSKSPKLKISIRLSRETLKTLDVLERKYFSDIEKVSRTKIIELAVSYLSAVSRKEVKAFISNQEK